MLNLELKLKVKRLSMRIGELARRSELSTSRIRFYEAHGLLPKAERSDNGYRDYPDSVLETLRLIQGAQDLGFSLGEIRAGLAQAGANPP
jgi:MerR family transcriptional regulator, copper efflux regulator